MVHPDSAQLGAQPKHEDDILNRILDFLLETAILFLFFFLILCNKNVIDNFARRISFVKKS